MSPAAKIPEVDKQLVLFHSDQLEKIRDGARLLDTIGNWLPVIVVAIGACCWHTGADGPLPARLSARPSPA